MKIINKKLGQTMVEFGLVFALVGLGIIFVLASMDPEVFKSYFRSSVTPGGHLEGNGQLVVPSAGN